MIAALLLAALVARAEPPKPPHEPTWAHDSLWVGTAWEASLAGAGLGPSDLRSATPGLELDARTVSDGPFWLGAGTDQVLRVSRDADGRTVIDELSLQARVAGLEIRPATGDQLDLSIIGSRWDQTVYGLARPWTRLQLFVPMRVVALGFSDTDADTDHRLHYYAAAGAGFGADWLVRLAGAFGVRLRAEAAGETMHRVRRGARDEVRHTLWGRGEADLAVIDTDAAYTVGVWTDLHTQWEPRVTSGVQRQVLAGGLRVGVRFPPEKPRMSGPAKPKPTETPEDHQTNAQNQSAIEGVQHPAPQTAPPPPPPTDQEHQANDAANQKKIEQQQKK